MPGPSNEKRNPDTPVVKHTLVPAHVERAAVKSMLEVFEVRAVVAGKNNQRVVGKPQAVKLA